MTPRPTPATEALPSPAGDLLSDLTRVTRAWQVAGEVCDRHRDRPVRPTRANPRALPLSHFRRTRAALAVVATRPNVAGAIRELVAALDQGEGADN